MGFVAWFVGQFSQAPQSRSPALHRASGAAFCRHPSRRHRGDGASVRRRSHHPQQCCRRGGRPAPTPPVPLPMSELSVVAGDGEHVEPILGVRDRADRSRSEVPTEASQARRSRSRSTTSAAAGCQRFLRGSKHVDSVQTPRHRTNAFGGQVSAEIFRGATEPRGARCLLLTSAKDGCPSPRRTHRDVEAQATRRLSARLGGLRRPEAPPGLSTTTRSNATTRACCQHPPQRHRCCQERSRQQPPASGLRFATA